MSEFDRDIPSTDDVGTRMVELLDKHIAAMKEGDYADADRTGQAVLDRAMEALLESADEQGLPEDFLLKAQAREFEQLGNWEAALAVRRRLIELASTSTTSTLWGAHDDLAGLLFLLGDNEAALREKRLATAAARRDELEVILRMAVASEASLLIMLDRYDEAETLVLEGLGIPNSTDPIDELGPARLYVFNAETEAGRGRVEEARQILQLAEPIVSRARSMPNAAGYHSAWLRWWTVEARCSEIEGDAAGEVQALQQALALAEHIDTLEHCADVYTRAQTMRVLDRLATAHWRSSDFDNAQATRRRAMTIRRELHLPSADNDS